MTSDGRERLFSADRPILSRTEDLLGRSNFSLALARAIRGRRDRDSIVIALYGPWGSGKSSVKNMVLESLRESPDTCPLILEFTPWQWTGQDQLASAFFHEIGLLLEKFDTSVEGKKRAARWRSYGAYLTLGASLTKSLATLVPIVGLPIAELIGLVTQGLEQSGKVTEEGAKGLAAYAEATTQTLADLKRELAVTLAQLPSSILVVMDDIDRLSKDEIKLLFQLVKVNADFPNIMYLLLFPRDLVEKSLEVVAPGDGREFLEKIVQVGLDIPRIERSRLERMLFAGLDALLEGKTVGGRYDQHRWGHLFLSSLRFYFETLRDVHRFLAMFSFHVALFQNDNSLEVNLIDLVALEVLRSFEPDLYHRLPAAKAMLTGERSSSIAGQYADDEARQMVESLVNQVPESRRPPVQELLKQLFPPTIGAFGGTRYRGGAEEQWFRELRVSHPHVFDRYFQLAIPEGDISQADLDRLLSLVGHREEFVTELCVLKQRDLLEVTLDRLEAYKEHIDLACAVPFITALFDIGDDLPEQPPGFIVIESEMHVCRIIHWCLQQEPDAKKRGHILKAAYKATTGLYIPIMNASLEDNKREPQYNQAVFTVDNDDLLELHTLGVEKIRQAARSGALKDHPKMLYILYRWARWTDPEEPRVWVQQLVDGEDGALALLRGCIYRSSSTIDDTSHVYWSIRLKELEEFIPTNILEEKIAQYSVEQLEDKTRDAVHTFYAALKRRKEGRAEDE